MIRFVDPSELPRVAADNGLLVESDPYTGSLFLRRKSGGRRAGVVLGPQGVIDWSSTCVAVLAVCFRRGVGDG